MLRRLTLLAALAALAGCHHAAPPAAAAPAPALAAKPATLHPRLPIDRAGAWTLSATADTDLETDEYRFALVILRRHPSGMPLSVVRETAKTIVDESHANGLDPYLVLALIRVESTNWNWSRSEKDARGLMQVLPSTARSLARSSSVVWKGPDSLYDPKVNVRLGTRYLADLTKRFGSTKAALAAYNEGPTRLERQLARNVTPEDYATKILWFAERYRQIVADADSVAPGIARVTLALDQVEHDIDGKPSNALARARRATRIAARGSRVDLNRVTFSDLLGIDGAMTAKAARAIVDFRAENGGFRSLDELDGIPGVDHALAKRLRDRVQVTDVLGTVASSR